MQKYLEPGTAESMTVIDDAGRFMIAAGRAMERIGSERFAPYGLTISDVAPLLRLVQLGPMTAGELLESSTLLTSAPVVSHSINRLEDAGLVTRRAHESDGRKVVVEATDAGRRIATDLHREIHDLSVEFFAPLSDDETARLRSLLLRCLEPHLS